MRLDSLHYLITASYRVAVVTQEALLSRVPSIRSSLQTNKLEKGNVQRHDMDWSKRGSNYVLKYNIKKKIELKNKENKTLNVMRNNFK